jgi:acyl carrier protein
MNDVAAKSEAAPAVRARLLALIGQILERPDAAVPLEGRLSELGMSSIKMVNLMLAVEGEFDLSIPQQEITPENFRSVNSIEALLERLLASKT